MLHRIFVIVGIAIVVMSCSKSDPVVPDPIVEVKFDNIEYVKATIDGASYSATPAPSVAELKPNAVFFTITAPNTAGLFTLSITVNDTGKGTYKLGDGEDGIMSFTTFVDGFGITYTTKDGATGTVEIDKIDVTLKRVKGRFSGSVRRADGTTKEITAGTFEVKWS